MNKIKSSKLPCKKVRSHQVIFKIDRVSKFFDLRRRKVKVLKNIKLNFYSGEFVIIYGPSGCGKSTLLHTLLGLEPPQKGRVFLRGKSLYCLPEDERSRWRREKVGMVFQQSNWIKSLNVWENVVYPLFISAQDQSDKLLKQKALQILDFIGIKELAEQKPTELSGGEQQRVALARALIADPGIIVCDEPTGNLDSKNSIFLMHMLTRLNRIQRKAIIIVTHEERFLNLANRRVFIQDGKIINDQHD